MKEAKFIKKEDELAEYEIDESNKEVANTKEYKAKKWEEWKQMKRKLDKNKVYNFIGKAVVFLSANLMWTGLMILGFMQNTIY